MANKYCVQSIDRKKASNGNDFLLLKIDDKLVRFFDPQDFNIPVEPNQSIACELKQSSNGYWKGYKLRILDGSNNDSPKPNPVGIDSKTRVGYTKENYDPQSQSRSNQAASSYRQQNSNGYQQNGYQQSTMNIPKNEYKQENEQGIIIDSPLDGFSFELKNSKNGSRYLDITARYKWEGQNRENHFRLYESKLPEFLKIISNAFNQI